MEDEWPEKVLVTGDYYGNIGFYDYETGQTIKFIKSYVIYSTIQYYRKNTIAVGEKGDVNIYDITSGKKIFQVDKSIRNFCSTEQMAFPTSIADKQFAFVDINNSYLHIFTRPPNTQTQEDIPENLKYLYIPSKYIYGMACTHQKKLVIATWDGLFMYEPMGCIFIEKALGNNSYSAVAHFNAKYFVAAVYQKSDESEFELYDVKSNRVVTTYIYPKAKLGIIKSVLTIRERIVLAGDECSNILGFEVMESPNSKQPTFKVIFLLSLMLGPIDLLLTPDNNDKLLVGSKNGSIFYIALTWDTKPWFKNFK